MSLIKAPPAVAAFLNQAQELAKEQNRQGLLRLLDESERAISHLDLTDEEKRFSLSVLRVEIARFLPISDQAALLPYKRALAHLEPLLLDSPLADRLLLLDYLDDFGNRLRHCQHFQEALEVRLRTLTYTDASNIAMLAGRTLQVANAYLDLRALDDACRSLQHAEQLYRRLLTKEVTFENVVNLSLTLDSMGNLLRQQGKYTDAEHTQTFSIELLVHLLSTLPSSNSIPQVRRAKYILAAARDHLGLTLSKSARFREAAILHEQAVMFYRDLLDPHDPRTALDLAISLHLGGVALSHRGFYESAIASLSEAVSIVESLMQRGLPHLVARKAPILDDWGVVLRRVGKLHEAYAKCKEAFHLFSTHVAAGHREAETELAVTAGNLGVTLTQMEKLEEALEYFRVSVQLFKKWQAEGLYYLEGPLARVWICLVDVLVRLGEYGKGENELWWALETVPHRPEILEGGLSFYNRLQAVEANVLERGGLPRQEVDDGFNAFLEGLFLTIQGHQWQSLPGPNITTGHMAMQHVLLKLLKRHWNCGDGSIMWYIERALNSTSVWDGTVKHTMWRGEVPLKCLTYCRSAGMTKR
jgi:tetratricopeptide (TPR) repeat protein